MINVEGLIKSLGPERVKRDEPLCLYTSLGVGGPADLFYVTENSGDLIKAVRLSRSFGVSVTIIGEGSNLLVSDKGVRGLVVRNRSNRIQVRPKRSIVDIIRKKQSAKAEVVIDSGVDIDFAVDELLALGIVGLEKLSKYPGTIGAKVSHKEGREFLRKISMLDLHGGVRSIWTEEIPEEGMIIDATYLLSYGETEKPMNEVRLMRKERKGGVERSAKGIFKDISEEDRLILGYPTKDVGYIIGEIMNMKGFQVGNMAILSSNPNVIVNLGDGEVNDFIAIVKEVKKRARESIGLDLEEKVVKLGF